MPRSTGGDHDVDGSSSGTVEGRSSSTKRKRREKSGCLTCRGRRVKCDEVKDVCGNCARLKLQCAWSGPQPTSTESANDIAAFQKLRASNPCDACKASKIRCVRVAGSAACKACLKRGALACSAAGTISGSSEPRAGETSSAGGHSKPFVFQDHVNAWQINSLVDKYFATAYYGLYFAYIHENTFKEAIAQGTVSDPLLMMVCASAIVCDHTATLDAIAQAESWAEEAENITLRKIFKSYLPSDLMTVLLFQRFQNRRNRHTSEWLISGLATRMCFALQLNLEFEDRAPGNADRLSGRSIRPSAREAHRRLAWGTYIMDSKINSGDKALRQMAIDDMKIKLPCDEYTFRLASTNLEPPDSRNAARPAALGLSAMTVQMSTLRSRIRSLVKMRPRRSWVEGSEFYNLASELRAFTASIPKRLEINAEALAEHNGNLSGIIVLAVVHYLCYCELFHAVVERTYATQEILENDCPPASFVSMCRQERISNALMMASSIAHTISHKLCHFDTMIGFASCVSIRIFVMDQPTDAEIFVSAATDETLSLEDSYKAFLTMLRLTKDSSGPCGRLHSIACYYIACSTCSHLLTSEERESLTHHLTSDPGAAMPLATVHRQLAVQAESADYAADPVPPASVPVASAAAKAPLQPVQSVGADGDIHATGAEQSQGQIPFLSEHVERPFDPFQPSLQSADSLLDPTLGDWSGSFDWQTLASWNDNLLDLDPIETYTDYA